MTWTTIPQIGSIFIPHYESPLSLMGAWCCAGSRWGWDDGDPGAFPRVTRIMDATGIDNHDLGYRGGIVNSRMV